MNKPFNGWKLHFTPLCMVTTNFLTLTTNEVHEHEPFLVVFTILDEQMAHILMNDRVSKFDFFSVLTTFKWLNKHDYRVSFFVYDLKMIMNIRLWLIWINSIFRGVNEEWKTLGMNWWMCQFLSKNNCASWIISRSQGYTCIFHTLSIS